MTLLRHVGLYQITDTGRRRYLRICLDWKTSYIENFNSAEYPLRLWRQGERGLTYQFAPPLLIYLLRSPGFCNVGITDKEPVWERFMPEVIFLFNHSLVPNYLHG